MRSCELTGELLVLAGHLEAHAAGAAAVQAAQLEGGASVTQGVRGKDHRVSPAPARHHLQQPHAAQEAHLQSTWRGALNY